MKNAGMPAMPIFDECGRPTAHGMSNVEVLGLTKREMMAMHMMAALLVGCESPNNDFIASISVDATEKLLAELDRTSK